MRGGGCPTRNGNPGLKSLRDLTEAELHQHGAILDPVIFRRCRHVVTENRRVLEGAGALESADLKTLRKLMLESHASLRDDYEVSSPELDFLVVAATKTGMAFGSRMTGGGFGGCTINIVRSTDAERFARAVSDRYNNQTDRACEVYISNAVAGAGELGA